MIRWGMKRALPVALACLVCALGCQSNSDSTQLPTTPSPGTTETFSGTVNVGQDAVNPFNIMLSGGALAITLTAVVPPSTVVGVAVGTWDGTTCASVSGGVVVTTAGTSPQLSGGQFDAGRYCVRVFDPGNLSASVNYTVLVNHY